jgi:hypothetical protein
MVQAKEEWKHVSGTHLTCLLRAAPLARLHLLQHVNVARDSIRCPSKVELKMLFETLR